MTTAPSIAWFSGPPAQRDTNARRQGGRVGRAMKPLGVPRRGALAGREWLIADSFGGRRSERRLRAVVGTDWPASTLAPDTARAGLARSAAPRVRAFGLRAAKRY